MKLFKKVLSAVLAAALLVVLAGAKPTMATVKTVQGWDNTTVASFAETVDFDALKSYTFIITLNTAVTDSVNFQIVCQNAVDWAWNQATVGNSTEAVDWNGINFNYAWVKVDDNTISVTIPNEGGFKLMTMNDKLAVGDWNDYDITDVKVTFSNEAIPAEEPVVIQQPEEPDIVPQPEEPNEDITPKTGFGLTTVFVLTALFGAGFVGTKLSKKEEK